jgi:molybdate transport system substrate-binding protein
LHACHGERLSLEDGETGLTVFAAASLRDVFTALGAELERAHPGVKVTFNFAGTQELRTQLEQGAQADVFASADQHHMDELVMTSRVSSPVVFARNEPVVVVATDSARKIASFANLPTAERIVVGAREVPIGRYTAQILERAGAEFRAQVEAKIVSRELNVKQVLAKVSLGEAQAGVVYRTDALAAAESVEVVTIPENVNVIAEYPIAIVSDAPHRDLARAWIDLVLSSAGRRALKKAGFILPSGSSATP